MSMYNDEYIVIARTAQDALGDISSDDSSVDGETFLEEAGRKIVDAISDLGYTVKVDATDGIATR